MDSVTSQLMTSRQELEAVRASLRQAEKERQESEERWKTDNDRLQVGRSSSSQNSLSLSLIQYVARAVGRAGL